jgi:hypothetical protein
MQNSKLLNRLHKFHLKKIKRGANLQYYSALINYYWPVLAT